MVTEEVLSIYLCLVIMAPIPQNPEFVQEAKKMRPPPGDEVVISGMSGIFPKSDSVQQFMENLYNKVDMVTTEDPRWVFNHPEVPQHLGQVQGMGKFDAQFFRVHYKQACTMEPMSRKLLEHAYSAIYDSGINPLQLRGKKVGVFIGSTFSESEKIVIYENVQRNGFGITGCNKAMYANRISYWIDGKGPSYSLDVACASSTACLEHAYRSISSGQCDAAIVGGCNLCMHPKVSLHCRRSGFVCFDGKTKCFDKNSDGYVRADTISVMFLQRAKDAKRIYSEVYHAKMSYSPESKILRPIRQPKELQDFIEAFYSEIDVAPESVEYVEANGAAIVEADTNELKVISQIFAKNKPIKVGCVKSNMGSSEPASGICGLTKVCLAFHNGQLPGNLHYEDPLDIPEINNGKVQVITDNSEFNRGLVALNSFSYSGANVHVLLKAHHKPKDLQKYKSSIPHLVLISGRKESCVEQILLKLKSNPIDPEQIGLLNNIHMYDIPGHLNRGYCVLDTNENNKTLCLTQHIEYCPGNTRPVWFVYSGMGSQWAGMGAELMRIPIFAAAIQKCHKVLEPKGIDIVKILTDPDKTIYDNILHSFVGIAAVQIGLTDILKELGIVPDNIIGHSVGELGCAYADGCFTAEEMILSAYSRGLVSVQTPFIKGSMAAVGLGYETVLPLCPPEIEVACHNSSESATISGPSDIMKQFVAELTGQGIFAKEVPCSNIAYHSRYIAGAGPGLLKYLSEVIKNPKERSKKWVSTSVPQEKWNDPIAKFSSAEYHTNNLLNSVLFEETSKLIPSDALVIEIAPHGLLQAILKRSLSECIHVPLTRRGTKDPVKFLLDAIGKLYETGLNPKIDALYPKIEYPVSTGTPFLSHFVEWEHSEDWPQAKYFNKDRVTATVRDFVISIHDDDFPYKGHVRNGNYVFPEAAFLFIIWETLAMYKGVDYNKLSVIFRDVYFHQEVIINTELPVRLQIMIHKGNNHFEVTYEETTVVSGSIRTANEKDNVNRLEEESKDTDSVILSSDDIYTIMRLKGYSLKDEFQSIHSMNSIRKKANIKWTNNWMSFIDSLIQFNVFARDHDGISTPLMIKTVHIDVDKHNAAETIVSNDVPCMKADLYSLYDYTKCGGVIMDGIKFTDIAVTEKSPDVLMMKEFVPHFLTGIIDFKTSLQTNLQIVSENVDNNKVNVIGLTSKATSVVDTIKELVAMIPNTEFVISCQADDKILNKRTFEEIDLILVNNLLGEEKTMQDLYNVIPINSFVLTLEEDTAKISPKYKLFEVITAMNVQKQILVLLRKVESLNNVNTTYLPIIQDKTFSWISRLQAELVKSRRVVLVSERQPTCGLLGMVKKLRQKHSNNIGLIVVDDYHITSFNPENRIYKEQLQKNLNFNVLKKGQWGGYYYISPPKTAKISNVILKSSSSSDPESLIWVEENTSNKSSMKVQVCYTGPSLKDAEHAESKSSKQVDFGMDFSGVDERGRKVMGLVESGAIASTVEADPNLLWPVPEHWTLEDAATVPLPYILAYYSLAIRSDLTSHESVFVHGGLTALGQAVISICLGSDVIVYTSVNNLKEKEILLRLFPKLDQNNICHYSQIVFEDMDDTNPKNTQCSTFINCLSGPTKELRESALKVLSHSGVYLDSDNHDMLANAGFGMSFLKGRRHYVSVQLSTIFKPEFSSEKKLLQELLSCGIADGSVRPLSRVIYSQSNVSRAFRLVATSKYRGKVLIKMMDTESSGQELDVAMRMTYSSKGSYIVVCDDTILGVELADRLVKHGARKLTIHIKPNSVAGYCYSKFLSWNKQNVSIKISSENLQSEKGCVNLLKEGAKLGPILGVFIVQNLNSGDGSLDPEYVATKFNNTTCVVANLDLTSRTICNELEHFVIVNYSKGSITDEYISSVTDKICEARNEINLPALVQRVDLIKELDDIDNSDTNVIPQSLSEVFNALDASMKLKCRNIISFNLGKDHVQRFISRIEKIIGIQDINKIDEKLPLNTLVDKTAVNQIQEALKESFNISYSTEKFEQMTVAEIKDLGNDLSKTTFRFEEGLETFFTQIEADECKAAEPLIPMPTSFSKVKEEEDLDPEATYLMLIPGFEGHHEFFTTICERLKVQAMAFQYEPELIDADIPEIAANMFKLTKKRFKLKSKFYLLGYSFGVNVALELAALFEKEGHVGVVYCLDSSPDAVRAQLDAYIGNLTDSELQNKIIQHMYKLMSGRDGNELTKELSLKDSWNEKIELCLKKLTGTAKYSHQYKRCLLQSAYKRIMLARQYKPKFKLESELVLLKGVGHVGASRLPEDYGLSAYCLRPARVFPLAAGHAAAPLDCRVTNIVNKLLEPKLLDEFNNKNRCWSYLADPLKTF